MVMILQDIPLGRNIQNLRIAHNMTQEELVAQMQLLGSTISRSTLGNIEVGLRNIKASDLKLIKTILNVDYSALFES